MRLVITLLCNFLLALPYKSVGLDSCPANTFRCEGTISYNYDDSPTQLYGSDYGDGDYGEGGYEEGSYEGYSPGGDASGGGEMKCLPDSMRCDGKQDCIDCSDERNCSEATMFWCGEGSERKCIPLSGHCDDISDCAGGEDECDCEGTIRCNSSLVYNQSICVPQSNICDLKQHCHGNEDESNCEYFVCPDTRILFPSKVCDGTNDCMDTTRSDECNCSFTFVCGSDECIHKDKLCDGTGDCDDGSDECDCINTPEGGFFRCHGSKKCIPPSKVCDGVLDCDPYLVPASKHSNKTYFVMDCSDETEGNCSTHFLCRSAASALTSGILDRDLLTCVHENNRCNGKSQCDDSSDECGCEESVLCPTLSSSEADSSSSKCILRRNFCDATSDCIGGLDERRTGFGMKCLMKSSSAGGAPCLLPQSMIDDGVADCSDKSDVCYRHGNWKCFRCFDHSLLISSYQVCDGIIDCPDLSDECPCSSNQASLLCSKICGMSGEDDCVSGTLQCGEPGQNSTRNNITLSRICDGVPDCNVSDATSSGNYVIADEEYCGKWKKRGNKTRCRVGDVTSTLKPLYAIKCDGRPECSGFVDECDPMSPCEPVPSFCVNVSTSVDVRLRGEMRFRCFDGILDSSDADGFGLPGAMVCDGKVDCAGAGEDELNTTCPLRYMCLTGDGRISIDEDQICDGRIDCLDESDEMKCSQHFYCENADPLFVDKSLRFDGVDDCTDQSDECPKDQLEGTLASSRDMIASPVLRTAVWIMAVVSVLGNFAVIIYQILIFCCKIRPSIGNQDVAMSNRVMILNLAVADLLTGLYLLILALQSVRFSGTYCHFDKIWRTSSWCANLGFLNSIATEAAVVIVVLMTTYRLCAVYLPFETSITGPGRIAVYCGCGWMIAIMLTIVPRLGVFSNYFIGHAWLPLPFFDSDIVSMKELEEFTRRYHVLTKNESVHLEPGWSAIESFLQEDHLNASMFAKFGYYSKHSVCIPNMLASPTDPAVGYSVAITTINLAAFLYIVVAYIFIYKGAMDQSEQSSSSFSKDNPYYLSHQSSRPLTGDGKSRRSHSVKAAATQASIMQARIFRLVASNVVCWLPISIMAFLKLCGVALSNDAYAYAAIILLPITSALNPILYSNFVSFLWTKMKICCKKTPSPSTDVFTSERAPLSETVRTTNV